MAYHIISKHTGGMAFTADILGHTVTIDTVADQGGNDSGPRPKHLLLHTLAACTGMDIVSLLSKMRVEFSDFSMDIKTDLTEEHPKVFTDIYMIYNIRVAEAGHKKVEKAVNLSQDKYCGISAMLGKNSKIHFSINYL